VAGALRPARREDEIEAGARDHAPEVVLLGLVPLQLPGSEHALTGAEPGEADRLREFEQDPQVDEIGELRRAAYTPSRSTIGAGASVDASSARRPSKASQSKGRQLAGCPARSARRTGRWRRQSMQAAARPAAESVRTSTPPAKKSSPSITAAGSASASRRARVDFPVPLRPSMATTRAERRPAQPGRPRWPWSRGRGRSPPRRDRNERPTTASGLRAGRQVPVRAVPVPRPSSRLRSTARPAPARRAGGRLAVVAVEDAGREDDQRREAEHDEELAAGDPLDLLALGRGADLPRAVLHLPLLKRG